jgi:hypothetical protein
LSRYNVKSTELSGQWHVCKLCPSLAHLPHWFCSGLVRKGVALPHLILPETWSMTISCLVLFLFHVCPNVYLDQQCASVQCILATSPRLGKARNGRPSKHKAVNTELPRYLGLIVKVAMPSCYNIMRTQRVVLPWSPTFA